MGPPRRNPPQTLPQHQMPQIYTQQPPQTQRDDPPSTIAQTPSTSLGMSPSERYESNLKVLRRRDPSIVSIFDQFGHVCVYHYENKKWEKQGFEGSMFLFERSRYPPYGLYILNRMGSEDYIQSLYPEDDVVDNGKFLIVKSYPDYLADRLATIEPNSDGTPLDLFSPKFAIPGIDTMPVQQKGRVVVVAFWILTDGSRESMFEVMKRLNSCIRKNTPYPQNLRYGPGRPPPPHRLKAVRKPGQSGSVSSSSQSHSQAQSDSENDQRYHSDAPSASSGELSVVDKLFMNMQTPAVPSTSATSSASQQTTQPTNVTLSTLFASAITQPSSNTQVERPASTASNTGIPLLDSIFASAVPAPQPVSAPPTTSVFSPQPSAAAPQILNENVVSTLLGLPPPRTPSAASGYSTSALSHPSSREGDNEDDDESDSPSPIFQMDETATRQQSASTFARNAGSDLLSSLGLGIPRLPNQGKVNGDVTPRNGFQRPPVPAGIEAISSTHTVRQATAPSAPSAPARSSQSVVTADPNGKPRANRALVPFAPDSELWPYSRSSAEESSHSDGTDDGEIMELSFEETSVLSDPEAFDKALKSRKSAVNLRAYTNGNGAYPNAASATRVDDGSRSKLKGKKGRKDRDARVQAEIEKTWDIPPPSPASDRPPAHIELLMRPPASPSPVASPEPGSQSLPPPEMMKTPTMTARATLAHANGNGFVSPQKGKGKAVNGRTKFNGYTHGVDPEQVSESIIATMAAQPRPAGKMEKRQFTQEVLTLIHTDKAFVDMLWHEYMARVA